MDSDRFNEIVDDQLLHIKKVLASKGDEYARGDRLSNFKRAATRMGCAPEKALMFFREKHECSILDIIDDLERGCYPSKELIDEKVGDSINYLILLKALMYERIER